MTRQRLQGPFSFAFGCQHVHGRLQILGGVEALDLHPDHGAPGLQAIERLQQHLGFADAARPANEDGPTSPQGVAQTADGRLAPDEQAVGGWRPETGRDRLHSATEHLADPLDRALLQGP